MMRTNIDTNKYELRLLQKLVQALWWKWFLNKRLTPIIDGVIARFKEVT